MGQKSKADQYGLKELIAEKWDGGKKTLVYVTDEVNEWLKENGYKITVSREAIRRAVRSYEDGIADAQKSIEMSKAIAKVLRDSPGTEQAEAMLMFISHLCFKDLQNYESINFEDPAEMIHAIAKLTAAQAKLSQYRTQAVKALDKAKEKIKTELQSAITRDPDLLRRLCKIVDDVKVA